MADDTVKVADFGLSNTVETSCADGSFRSRTPVGTPLYAAPEVLNPWRYPYLISGRPAGGDGNREYGEYAQCCGSRVAHVAPRRA